MSFTKNQILSHLDAIIGRQFEEIDVLVNTKPKPIATLIRSREKLNRLRDFRRDYVMDLPIDQSMLNKVVKDMNDLGWNFLNHS